MLNTKKGSIASKILISILILITFYFLFFTFNVIKGSDETIFKNNQRVLSEKISLYFREPKEGDAIIYTKGDDMDWVGVIIETQRSNANTGQNTTTYRVVNSLNPKNDLLITKDKILSHIFYPSFKITETDLNSINESLDKDEEEQTQKSYNKPPNTITNNYTNITGTVYIDENKNGKHDNNEVAPTNYFPSIALDNINRSYRYKTVNADINGVFAFSEIAPGKYIVILDDVPNYSANKKEEIVEISTGTINTVNFGLIKN